MVMRTECPPSRFLLMELPLELAPGTQPSEYGHKSGRVINISASDWSTQNLLAFYWARKPILVYHWLKLILLPNQTGVDDADLLFENNA